MADAACHPADLGQEPFRPYDRSSSGIATFAASDTTGAPLALIGSFTIVWLRTDGQWKVVNSAETYPLIACSPY